MQISYGFLSVLIVVSVGAGAILGALIVAVYSDAQVGSLNQQLSERTVLCRDCETMKRLTVCHDKLQDRESYIKSLEERIDKQRRSITALGVNLQKRLRVVV